MEAIHSWKVIDSVLTEAMNETKDNVKYLSTLDALIEPLYTGTPASVMESLPAMVNNIKMIYTLARYYNTSERMTRLFSKITNQMIVLCKSYLLQGKPVEDLWNRVSVLS